MDEVSARKSIVSLGTRRCFGEQDLWLAAFLFSTVPCITADSDGVEFRHSAVLLGLLEFTGGFLPKPILVSRSLFALKSSETNRALLFFQELR